MLRWMEGFDVNTDPDGAGYTARYVDVTLPDALTFVTGREEAFAYSAQTDPFAFSTPEFTDRATWVVGMSISGQDQDIDCPLIVFKRAGVEQLMLQLSGTANGDLNIQVYRGVTLLAEHTVTDSFNPFYLEFKTTIHTSAGTYELRINEITVLSATGQNTASGGSNDADQIAYHFETASADGFLYVDDLYVVDSAAGEHTDFLGECIVEEGLAIIQGAGDDWSPRTVADVMLDMIDDADEPDGEASYIVPTDVAQDETFQFVAPDVIQTVLGVQVEAVVSIDVGAPGIKLLAKSGATTNATANLSGGAAAPDYGSVNFVWEENPDTSAAWTVAELVSAEFGVRSAS